VRILRCRRHPIHFTVYPVGFTPYGRERIAPVEPDGEPAWDAAGMGVKPWRGTFFRAAIAAAEGRLWLREGYSGDFQEPLYRTQARWIERGGTLLGLSADIDEACAEAVARSLGVRGLDHARARRQMGAAGRLADRGQAIVGVLEQISLDASVGGRLLAAGHRVRLWGAPSLWSPQVGRRLFPGPGTVALGLASRPP
jgi:hypothetical protein